MKKNLGKLDRIVRAALAATISILYFTGTITGMLGTVLLLLGGILLFTSYMSSCPIYNLFGIRSCPIEKEGKE